MRLPSTVHNIVDFSLGLTMGLVSFCFTKPLQQPPFGQNQNVKEKTEAKKYTNTVKFPS